MTTIALPQLGETLRRITSVVAATLRVPVDTLRPQDSFAQLGMDSLVAIELATALEQELEIQLPPTGLYEYPTLEALGEFIDDGPTITSGDRQHARMLADAELSPDIRPPSGPSRSTRDARVILLTGATGFVGAHLLRRFVDECDAQILCLVRPSAIDSELRLEAYMSRYGLWSDTVRKRISVVEGDLTRPRAGLNPVEWRRLAADVDVIYHAAADVNWVYGYDALRDANVNGTRELLALACSVRPKTFHFLSSVSVCHSTSGPQSIDESVDPLASLSGLRLGYAQSKCVGESLVRQAGERGLPVSIIRPALVTGDSRSGRSNADDLVARFIAGCIHMGTAPDLDWRLDCVPVDEVVDAALRLSQNHSAGISTWHIAPERPRHWRELVLWMRMSGYNVRLLPYQNWLLQLTSAGTRNPLHSLKSFFVRQFPEAGGLTLPELFEEERRPQVSSQRTRDTLKALGQRPAPIDSMVLSRYFDYFVDQSLIPEAGDYLPGQTARNKRSLLDPHSAQIERGLQLLSNDDCLTVEAMDYSAVTEGESIIAELSTSRSGSSAGLYDATINVSTQSGNRTVKLFVKSKPSDERVIEVALSLAEMVSPVLGETLREFRNNLGITNCHKRELALYTSEDPRLRTHTPAVVFFHRDDVASEWVIALENIDDAVLMNAMEPSAWTDAAIDAAIVGLARIHAIWMNRAGALECEEWMPPRRDCELMTTMSPLWKALRDHAVLNSLAWQDIELQNIHAEVVAAVPVWAQILDTQPKTLIHNDFNPRNIAIRRSSAGLTLCAYDWELATIGAPQRDLAELLSFVLPADAPRPTIARWVARHRSLLEKEAGIPLSPALWKSGFSAALCELLVDRLASYAMIDRVRPQRFLPGVVRSWKNIYNHYPLNEIGNGC